MRQAKPYCSAGSFWLAAYGFAADVKIVTSGTANLKESAHQRARLECRKAGGKNCAIAAWVCSKM